MDANFNKPPDSRGPEHSTGGFQKPGTADQPAQIDKAAKPGRLNIKAWSKEIPDILYAVSRLPEVREARVREIKERIFSGAYVVDPRRVAEAILKNQ